MGNDNASGARDGALLLARFREADAAYEAVPDAEKPKLFARRHAALMLVLGTHPRSRDEVCAVMRIALDELTRDVMLDGPVFRAVANALGNCLQAIEDDEAADISIEPHVNGSPVSEPSVDLESGVAKLDSFAGLLAYLANNSGGKEMQHVFFALLTNIEAIRDTMSAAAD